MSPPRTATPPSQDYQRRELYLFALYRVLEAGVLALLVFGPVATLQPQEGHEGLVATVAAAYVVLALMLVVQARKAKDVVVPTLVGVGIDILVGALVAHAVPTATSGVALMLLFNVGSASLLLSLRMGLSVAALASAGLAAGYLWMLLVEQQQPRPMAELMMFTVSFLAIATLTHQLRVQMRATEALAERRGAEAVRLAEINELIIRRMRTGVLLVDGDGTIKLANESAMLQLGNLGGERRSLGEAAPELAQRLREWRSRGDTPPAPLQLAPDLPEVLPRFARLLAEGDQALVFLDDTSKVTRRAESLTLATLGRFSASLAHEIRNPLAAISYATQLLEESRDIPEADRRLLEIIYQQTLRMNGIVENVLGLARRERAQPEQVELAGFVRHFAEEYRNSHPLNDDQLDATAPAGTIAAMVDRRQLQQVLTALVHNALVYGRMPGEPARVGIRAYADEQGNPTLDVTDRGPGIPDSVAEQLFRPFFTTSGEGTGLGLYIARELCMANQASLQYVPVPAGGACFRIRLPGSRASATA